MDDEEFDVDKRILCSDDTCIGLIGVDGRCKVCGLTYTGSDTIPAPKDIMREVPVHRDTAPLDGVSEYGDLPHEMGADSPDDSERVCCPDDTCIGIIGKDGRCGVCGKLK
jgi:hypothetical protein